MLDIKGNQLKSLTRLLEHLDQDVDEIELSMSNGLPTNILYVKVRNVRYCIFHSGEIEMHLL